MIPKKKSSHAKHFEIRESLLTQQFEKCPHMRTVRNMFLAILFYFVITSALEDYFLHGGRTWSGFRLIKYNFGNIHIALLAWIFFIVPIFLCYWIFIKWATFRINIISKYSGGIYITTLDLLFCLLLTGYYIFTAMPAYIVRRFDLPPGSAAIVLVEQARWGMKIYAFVRGNAPTVLKYKHHSDESPPKLPTFWNFLYFLFAPTLIYRDEYPRTKTIRWKFVLFRLLELFACILLLGYIWDRYILPPFRDFGIRKFSWAEIVIAVFQNIPMGLLVMFLAFYMLLHSVQNGFAEVLRFGDRMFYSDWWTSSEYSEYYRKWNIVVHEWLFEFVYKDVYKMATPPRNKYLATITVFGISALVHEWIYCNMAAIFFPAIMIQFFVLGTTLHFLKMPKNNLFNAIFLFLLGFGSSGLIELYSLEYYARLNAPAHATGFWNSVLPRWLTCDCIQS